MNIHYADVVIAAGSDWINNVGQMKAPGIIARRHVMAGGAGLIGAACTGGSVLRNQEARRESGSRRGTPAQRRPVPQVMAFDAFPVFDPRPVQAKAEAQLGPTAANELLKVWRSKQFEYTWWLAAAGRYLDFWSVTERALSHANRVSRTRLTDAAQQDLMSTFLALPAWADTRAALERLRDAGVKLALLSNFTKQMLDCCLAEADLADLFDAVLSTDGVRSYKPAPAAYSLASDHFGLPQRDIGFAAFAGWDALGASWFGYDTYWVNRQRQPAEALQPATREVSSLRDLAAQILLP